MLSFVIDWAGNANWIKAWSSDGLFAGLAGIIDALGNKFKSGWEDVLVICESIYNILVDSVNEIVYISGLLTSFLGNIPNYFAWLPGNCIGLLITLFGIVAVYMIAGRK